MSKVHRVNENKETEEVAGPRGPSRRTPLLRLFLATLSLAAGAGALVACGNRVELAKSFESDREREALYSRLFGEEVDDLEVPRAARTAFLESQALAEEAASCRAKIQVAQEQLALPGAPRLEARRAQVLARAKAEPVLFLETPAYSGDVSRGVHARRNVLVDTEFPRDVFRETIRTFRDNPQRLRELLLRNGYLYTDDPRAARLLTLEVTLEMLFKDEEIILERGAETLRAKRGPGRVYYFENGTEKGRRATLLLYDRVYRMGEEPGKAIHVDVRELAQREGMSGLRIVHLGHEQIVAEARFENEWVPVLLNREGPNLSTECLLVEPEEAARVGRARDSSYRRALVLRAIRSAVAEQVRLGLPFDEPRTEHGQQDGKLRARWEKAYFGDSEKYKFNGDSYSVYNRKGEPMTPQVCIDFVTETLERASGMHFSSRPEKPQKVMGALDFDEILQGRRRQELALREYARSNPHRLDMIDYPLNEWVRYEKIDQFFGFLEKERDNIRPGDIVIIRGRAAWDRYKDVHTHTFFIYEADPMTGMPTLLTGNAGKPRISTWDGEMLRAPRRSIRHRIRPNMEWLYDHLVLRTPLRGERWAAPLSVAER